MACDPKRVKEVFMVASEHPPEERAAYLDRECAGDAELRQRVEALLQVHDEPASFLNAPSNEPTGPYRAVARQALVIGQTFAGRFKLREELGEGGMGVVYVADQTEPVQRRVALKVIRGGAESSLVLARFEQERQALAMMDHPNIAKVFDAGISNTGQPFFVMELIKGVPLTKYCDEAKLSPGERLALFVPVCQAVQHAHQKGVIHRDLKPSNILVGLYDGRPVPKVIDFGVAKATGSRISEHTVYTEVGSVIGTLEYMSPEQAELNNLDIDTRSDIYSLGVILYELLTGSVPFSRKDLGAAGFVEMLRVIKEKDPPKPSTRLSQSRELPSVAAQRHTEPAKLSKLMRGDLDWITMKALEKDRTRRYETANGLARDVQRYLDDEPVEASPPSASYRLRKFAKKNRAALTTAAAIAFLLLAGIGVSSWQAIRANQAAEGERMARVEAQEQKESALQSAAREAEERKKAETAKAEAQAKEAEANAVVRFFEEKVFAAARPKNQAGGLDKEVSLRDAIAASLPALGQGFAAQPLVEARLRLTLGNTFHYLAEYEQARDQAEQSRALFTRHRGPDYADTLSSMHNLANSYAALNRPAEALKLHEEVLAIRKRVLPTDHPDTLMSMNNLANSYRALNRPAEALKLHEEVLAIRKRVLPTDHPDTLMSMNNLANSYFTLNRPAEALKLHEEVLAIRKRVLPKDHPDTLMSMNNLAISYAALNRRTEALKLREDVLEIMKRVLPKDHPDTLTSMGNLANSYAALNRPAEALMLNEEVLAIRKRVLPKDHPDTLKSMNNLAISYRALNRPAEALKLREEVLEIMKRVLPKDHPDTLMSMSNLAISYAALNRPAEALKLFEDVLAIRKRVLPKDHPDTLTSMNNLATSYAALNRPAEALKLREEVLAIRKRVLTKDHSDTLTSMWLLAESLLKLDRGAEAIPLIDECVAKAGGQTVDPHLIPRVLVLRMGHFQKLGDPAGCRATAAMWEKLNRPDAHSLYDAACFRAVTAGVQAKTPGADASRLAREDADKAMEWLHKAVKAGYKDAARMKKDPDLNPLREREDFKKLIAELEAMATPKKETEPAPLPRKLP